MFNLLANVPEKYDHIDFKPPEGVAKEAEKGLEYRKKQGKDKAGLTTEEAGEQGIGSGVQRAVNLKNRTNVSPEVIGQMVGFFARHEKNKDISEENEGTPWKDKGYVSWLLWGGDAGRSWAEKVKKQMAAADEKAKKSSSIAQRVAERSVEAGKLEPPSKMLKQALSWFQGKIALRVLERSEVEEQKYLAPDEASKFKDSPMGPTDILYSVNNLVRLHSMFHEMGNADAIYGREESVDTTQGPLKVRLVPGGQVELSWNGKTLQAPKDSFNFGEVVSPWLQENKVQTRRVSRDYQDHKRLYDASEMSAEDREARLQELEKVRAMYRSWEGNHRGIDNPMEVDLTGWYKKVEDFPFQGLPKLSMGLNMSPGSLNGGFVSTSDNPTVMIDMPNDILTVPGSQEMTRKLEAVLTHEMRHYAQYLFRLYRDIEETGTMYGNEAYLPHALRTLEYDTIIADEVTELRRYLQNVPGYLHPIVFKAWTNALTSRDKSALEEYRAWIKENPRHFLPSRFVGSTLKLEEGRQFFNLLRENDPTKWKRAVKTLARNVKLSPSPKRSHMSTTAKSARKVIRRILKEKIPVIASHDPKFAYDLYRQEDLNRGNNSSREEYPTTDLMSDKVLKGLQERIDSLSDKIEEYQDKGVDHSGLYDDREDLIRERDGLQRFLKDTLGFTGMR